MNEGTANVRPLLAILWTCLGLAYPVVVYVGLQRWPTRVVSVVLLGLLAGLWIVQRLSRRVATTASESRDTTWPLLAAGLLVLGALLGHGVFIKSVPVLVSGALLAVFALSLRGPRSFVERLARRQEPDLSPAKIHYCRQVTVVWCWFFVLNIAITLGLAAFAPLSWWTLYTGVIAYVLIGSLFTAEYVTRKARFRDYGRGWHDRALALVFPPRHDDG